MTPETESVWVESNDPETLLRAARGKVPERKFRLFAVACCRRVWDLFTEERCRQAVEAAEAYCDGGVSISEMVRLRLAAGQCSAKWGITTVVDSTTDLASEINLKTIQALNAAARLVTEQKIAQRLKEVGQDLPFPNQLYSGEVFSGALEKAMATFVPVLRDIFGNPFRPVRIDPAWRTPTVTALAEGIYADRRFADLPILADALEEAGCTSEDILAHCRGGGDHVRGCWAVDLILARE